MNFKNVYFLKTKHYICRRSKVKFIKLIRTTVAKLNSKLNTKTNGCNGIPGSLSVHFGSLSPTLVPLDTFQKRPLVRLRPPGPTVRKWQKASFVFRVARMFDIVETHRRIYMSYSETASGVFTATVCYWPDANWCFVCIAKCLVHGGTPLALSSITTSGCRDGELKSCENQLFRHRKNLCKTFCSF